MYFHKQTEYHLFRQLLQELSDQGLCCLQSVYKSVKRCPCELNGYSRIAVQQVLIIFQLVSSFHIHIYFSSSIFHFKAEMWLSGRVLDSIPKDGGFKPLWDHCVASLSKTH